MAPEYFDPIDAIEVKQDGYTFYIFKMNSKDLREIAYTSPRTKDRKKGIQRGLDKKRLAEIGEYLQQIDPPGILPNCIIASFSENTTVKDGKIRILRKPAGEAFVLDGQHRLFAFDPEYSKGKTMDLIVTGFIGLNDQMKAYIFRTINSTQKKINPSIVYDLIPMLRDNWVEFEDLRSQYLVQELNDDPSSPWQDGIDMLGGRQRTITQASFITRVKVLLKKGNIFENTEENEFYEQVIQKELLFEYFWAISETFKVAWKNNRYILCKNTGVAAMLNLLKDIVNDMKSKGKKLTDDKGLLIIREDFKAYITKIKEVSFSSFEYGSTYLGEAGIKELTELLKKKIFQ
jgi:DGQHR domain-containing protein